MGFGFCIKLERTKINKSQTKRANITGVQYFSAYQQGVVSSTLYFIIYHLSSLYLPHNFAPNFPFSPPLPPPIEHDTPSYRLGLKFRTAASPPNRITKFHRHNRPVVLPSPSPGDDDGACNNLNFGLETDRSRVVPASSYVCRCVPPAFACFFRIYASSRNYCRRPSSSRGNHSSRRRRFMFWKSLLR